MLTGTTESTLCVASLIALVLICAGILLAVIFNYGKNKEKPPQKIIIKSNIEGNKSTKKAKQQS